MAHWLLKSEPSTYSIDDLKTDRKTMWDGVRNYQARNTLRDNCKPGDEVLFYHSNAEPPAIVGLAKVVSAGYPDPSAFNKKDAHFDPDSDPKNPRWYAVDVQFVKKFARPLGLPELKGTKGLEKMVLLQKGSRLSVQPVTDGEFDVVLGLTGKRL